MHEKERKILAIFLTDIGGALIKAATALGGVPDYSAPYTAEVKDKEILDTKPAAATIEAPIPETGAPEQPKPRRARKEKAPAPEPETPAFRDLLEDYFKLLNLVSDKRGVANAKRLAEQVQAKYTDGAPLAEGSLDDETIKKLHETIKGNIAKLQEE